MSHLSICREYSWQSALESFLLRDALNSGTDPLCSSQQLLIHQVKINIQLLHGIGWQFEVGCPNLLGNSGKNAGDNGENLEKCQG